MSRSDRIFRRLLRLFPADFRGDFGEDMAATFTEQRRDALAQGGSMAALRLWWDTIRGITTTAPAEHLDLLRGDVRYALRNLRRNPGFTSVAVIALAVGIGANIAVFTIVNGVLIQSLPFADPAAVVAIFEKIPEAPVDKFDFSAPDFEIVRDAAHSFTGMAAYRNATYELSGISEPERLVAARVTPNLFTVLGVSPALGRAITEDDDRGDAKIAVLTNGLWSRAFGRDPAIVGRTISLDRQPYTVVGVMPEHFIFPLQGAQTNGEPAALYVPMSFSALERANFGGMYNNSTVARLKPGVSMAQARGELGSLVPVLAERYPAVIRSLARQLTLPISPLAEEVVGGSRRMLLVLMGAVGIVLLIGCADVANLMLTRAGSRQRELAVRAALGASPARVVRQLLTEGLVLAAIGGAAGLLLAYWTLQALLAFAGNTLPRVESIGFDRRVLTFGVALTFLTPVIFGIAPALRGALRSTFDALKEGGRSATPGQARHRLLGSLVVAQFALALMLSVGAGLLLRSFVRLLNTDPGFRADHVVTAAVTLPAGRYVTGAQVKQFYRQAVEAARAIPGVTYTAAGNDRALYIRERRTFTADATAAPIPTLGRVIAVAWTSGEFFQAMGIPLKHGRFFTDADGLNGARAAVISEMMARRLWPDQDAVGRQIKWGAESSRAPWMTVVGVVGDVKQGALNSETIPQAYEPLTQISDREAGETVISQFRTVNLVARTDRDPDAAVGALRVMLQRLDPSLPISNAQQLGDVVSESIKPQRFSMTVVGLFAIVALTLAAIGVYGVLANVVSQETHEIGVRMALGAQAGDVMWSVLRRALTLMAFGVTIGTAGALALRRVMAGLLYEVRPTDAATFAGAALLLAALAVAASLLPAWRATRVDPLVALRTE